MRTAFSRFNETQLKTFALAHKIWRKEGFEAEFEVESILSHSYTDYKLRQYNKVLILDFKWRNKEYRNSATIVDMFNCDICSSIGRGIPAGEEIHECKLYDYLVKHEISRTIYTTPQCERLNRLDFQKCLTKDSRLNFIFIPPSDPAKTPLQVLKREPPILFHWTEKKTNNKYNDYFRKIKRIFQDKRLKQNQKKLVWNHVEHKNNTFGNSDDDMQVNNEQTQPPAMDQQLVPFYGLRRPRPSIRQDIQEADKRRGKTTQKSESDDDDDDDGVDDNDNMDV